jgi:ABC-type dipeptide/oligopeptide/nickel transport system permease subunit
MPDAAAPASRPQSLAAAGFGPRAPKAHRPGARALRRLARNKLALLGSIVALLYILTGLFGPWLIQADYAQQDLMATFVRPFDFDNPNHDGHPLGTDQLGRDMLARLVMGIRISLVVGFGVTLISLVVGTVAGALAGYYGGVVDTIVSGIVELTWGFPLILIAVILTGAMGPGLPATILAIGLINWAGFARIVRGEVIALRRREYIEAARTVGVQDGRMLVRHIFPNVLAPVLVMASYYVALAIIVEAGLSFIGLGAQPPLPSLGVMIADGRNFLLLDHWVSTIPGIAIITIVMGLNLLGDGLRDALDPRLTNS